MKLKTLILLASLILSANASAIPDYAGAKSYSKGLGFDFLRSFQDQDILRYQIGDVFGKTPVTPADMQSNAIMRRMASATARYFRILGGGATGWYIGKFNGHHMVATNYHVANAEDGLGCGPGVNLAFPFLSGDGAKKTFKCEKLYGAWSDIDFGLVSIKVDAADESLFTGMGQNMRWNAEVRHDQHLMTVGFGIAKNAGQRNMMVNQDTDCKVYSGTNEFKFMADPDEVNPAPYKAWSFSIGCDISHGDSGSAFVDRHTGDVIGIVWTGGIPKGGKPAAVRTRAFMDGLTPASPEVWTTLSYAVPAVKIHAFLEDFLARSKLDQDTYQTISAIIR